MSDSLNAFDHKRWSDHRLQNYEEFSECVGECNQLDYGDYTEGEWFFAPEEPLPKLDHEGQERLVIYNGSWGNYNSPGASSYTYATVYYLPDDLEEYEADKKKWEEAPEWGQQDMECVDCHQQFDRDEMEFDDRKDAYVCKDCLESRNNPEGEENEDEGEEDCVDGPGQ